MKCTLVPVEITRRRLTQQSHMRLCWVTFRELISFRVFFLKYTTESTSGKAEGLKKVEPLKAVDVVNRSKRFGYEPTAAPLTTGPSDPDGDLPSRACWIYRRIAASSLPTVDT